MNEDVKIVITSKSGRTYLASGWSIVDFEYRLRNVDVSLLVKDERGNFVRLMTSAIESFEEV